MPNRRPSSAVREASDYPKTLTINYMWNRLGIKDDNPAKHALRAISQEVYDVVATEFGQKGNSLGHLFRSSAFRDRLTQAFDDRMDRVPTAVKENIPNQSELEIALIKYCQADAPMFKIRWDDQPKNEQGRPIPPPIIVAPPLQSLHQPQSAATKQTKAIAPPGAIGPQIEERYLQRNLTRTETFVYDRAHVVPNAGLQIIRANAPHQPIAVRLSDLLEDKTNPLDVSSDGDWVNASNIKMSTFKKNLVHDELYLEGETIWLSPFSLDSMDLTLMALAFPRDGEKRLVGMNLASVILRMIRENWPMLRKPSPELEGTGGSSPLHRLNMTIIIRGSGALGGAITTQTPLARPPPGFKRGREEECDEEMEASSNKRTRVQGSTGLEEEVYEEPYSEEEEDEEEQFLIRE